MSTLEMTITQTTAAPGASTMPAAALTAGQAEQAAESAQRLFQLAAGYMASAALQVALRLGIADHLANGPMQIDALARATHARPDGLYRVLRALASVGVFEEHADRFFALNGPAILLRARPGSLRDIAMFLTDGLHFRVYAELLHSVQTGQPAVERVTGMPVFELFARDTAESDLFNDAMSSMSSTMMPAVLQAYDFSGIKVLADIAGGHGRVLGSILQANPGMEGMLFDLDHVIAGAYEKLQEMGVSDRCEMLAGDFFYSVPRGADAYLMKHIIHDWDDEKALVILRNVRAALEDQPNGKVLLIESVIPSGPSRNEPHMGKLGDLEMMVLPGGRERTAEEFAALFARAGFTMTRIVPTASMMSVIEAKAVTFRESR